MSADVSGMEGHLACGSIPACSSSGPAKMLIPKWAGIHVKDESISAAVWDS